MSNEVKAPIPLPIPAPAPAPTSQPNPQTDQEKIAASADGAKFAALSRKEKQLVLEQDKLKKERAELKAIQDDIARWKSERDEFDKLKKLNPLEAMKRLGFSYEGLTAIQMNEGQPTPDVQINAVDAKLEEYKKQQETEKAQAKLELEQKMKADADSAYSRWSSEVDEFITANAETYELISINDSQALVKSVIEENYKSTGKVLSNKEACDLTEKFLEDQVEKNKKAKKFNKAVEAPAPKPQETAKPGWTSKTLNNTMTSTTPIPKAKAARTDKERIAAAMAKMDELMTAKQRA